MNTIRFLNQLRAVSGNYTLERDQRFRDLSAQQIVGEIKARRNQKS